MSNDEIKRNKYGVPLEPPPISDEVWADTAQQDFGDVSGELLRKFYELEFEPGPRFYDGLVPGPLDKFDRAIQTVTQERGANYGHPEDNFRRSQALVETIRECPDPELREALEAIARKAARLIDSPDHLDSWIDIAGYARCAAMILQRRHDRRSEDAGSPKEEDE